MFKRPTSMADAFITAAIPTLKKVDHQQRNQEPVDMQATWVARRVAHNATERGQFGMTTEYDKRPTPPKMRAALEHKEDFSDVPY